MQAYRRVEFAEFRPARWIPHFFAHTAKMNRKKRRSDWNEGGIRDSRLVLIRVFRAFRGAFEVGFLRVAVKWPAEDRPAGPSGTIPRMPDTG
ncbi:MAG TPA: hypothetical protein VKA14_07555, partial [Gammaproteobacteria bacterium]|nr:hypothetical protein [Gammaproteobacteria bacterium]